MNVTQRCRCKLAVRNLIDDFSRLRYNIQKELGDYYECALLSVDVM